MIVAWLALPVLLAGLALGVGLLVEALAGRRVPGPLLVPLGFAGIVVAGQATASFDPSADWTAPLVLVLAAAGLTLALRRRRPLRPDWPLLLCAVAVGAVYGAPVIASGEPTFAGYIRLDDTATWLTLTDRIMEHGRSLDGLARSTYEAALSFNLADGYPIGAFVPLGVAGKLLATDVAWLIQPYMSFLAALLVPVLAWFLRAVIARPWPRALAAALAAQPALLVGYAQWGGVKEVAAALLVALCVALALRLSRSRRPIGRAIRAPRGRYGSQSSRGAAIRTLFRVPAAAFAATRSAAPLAIAIAALLALLSVAGAIWLVPPLAFALLAAARRAGLVEALGRGVATAALTAVLSAPAIVTGAIVPPTSSPLTSDTAQGNLFGPLEPAQLLGVWPAGDFRAGPVAPLAADVLLTLVLAAAAIGLAAAWRRRAWPPLVYVAGTLLACAAILALGSPWVDAKAMAIAGPAVLIAAVAGAAALLAPGGARRIVGAAAVAAIALGVLWSNALAYRDANLAPYGQLSELERIGELIAGEGPALMTEYQPYGVRHFLRDADPEAVSELRRRLVPLRDGRGAPKGTNADTDEISPNALFVYRTLVLRRSPVQSRPPAAYHLVWSGKHYEVWQRPADANDEPARLPLGTGLDPTERLGCADLAAFTAREPGAELVAAARPGTVSVRLDHAQHPAGWAEGKRTVVPAGDGTVSLSFDVPSAGQWSAWLAGSIHGGVELLVDGSPIGSARHLLNNYGFFVPLGTAELARGRHKVELRFSGADLHPGSGGRPQPVGPLILTASEPAEAQLLHLPAAHARKLCGRQLDWVEILDSTVPR